MQKLSSTERAVVTLLDQEFASFGESLRRLAESVPAHLLYRQPPLHTIGENILKSAGVIEQTFGGITANLWDDPFEWTLPETLSTPDLILEYLSEVESTRVRAFSSFVNDDVLLKYIAVPSGQPCPIMELLLQTISRASDYRGRATATLKLLSDVHAPGFII
jgi:hypothetical protein